MSMFTYTNDTVILQGKEIPSLLQQWITRHAASHATYTTLSHDPEYTLRAGASYGDMLEEAASVQTIQHTAWTIPTAIAREEIKALFSLQTAQTTNRPMPWEPRIRAQIVAWGYAL